MVVAALVTAALAALVHVYIFVLESVRFVTPATMRTFGIRSVQDAETMKPWAFNQGFYNLFLAVETAAGVVAVVAGARTVGLTLVVAGTASMLLAAAVLIGSDRKKARAALVQGLFPALTLLALLVALLVG